MNNDILTPREFPRTETRPSSSDFVGADDPSGSAAGPAVPAEVSPRPDSGEHANGTLGKALTTAAAERPLSDLGSTPAVTMVASTGSAVSPPTSHGDVGAPTRRLRLVRAAGVSADTEPATARICYQLAGLLTAPILHEGKTTSSRAAEVVEDARTFARQWTTYVRGLVAAHPGVRFQLRLHKEPGLGRQVGVWFIVSARDADPDRARARVLKAHESLAAAHLLLARHVEWRPVVDATSVPPLPRGDAVELSPRELDTDAYSFAPWLGPGADGDLLAEAMLVWPAGVTVVMTLAAARVTRAEGALIRMVGFEPAGPEAEELRPEVHVYLASSEQLSEPATRSIGELLLDHPGHVMDGDRARARDGYDATRCVEEGAFQLAMDALEAGGAPAIATSSADPSLRRARHILSFEVAARIFRPPAGSRAAALQVGRPPGSPLDLPEVAGARLGVVRFCGIARDVRLTDRDASQHVYIVGRTGTGKSTLILNQALDRAREGHGVALIDPHGDMALDFLAALPPERADDVVVFDPTDVDFPIGLNLLEYDPRYGEQKSLLVNELFRIFEAIYEMRLVSGPLFEQYFRWAMLALMDDPERHADVTLLARFFSDRDYRRDIVNACTSPLVRRFWLETAERTSGDGGLANMAPYITSKLESFVANDFLLPIIGQSRSGFDFRRLLDNRALLVVRLNKGRLGGLATRLLGMVFVMRILLAAMSRSDLSPNERTPFYLFVDEVQALVTPTLAELMAEARKYGLRVTLANQNLKQVPEDLRAAILGNVGSIIGFRVNGEDAGILAEAMGDPGLAPALVSLQNYQAILRAIIAGEVRPAFTVVTPPPPEMDSARIDGHVVRSRARYGAPRSDVMAEIFSRHEDDE